MLNFVAVFSDGIVFLAPLHTPELVFIYLAAFSLSAALFLLLNTLGPFFRLLSRPPSPPSWLVYLVWLALIGVSVALNTLLGLLPAALYVLRRSVSGKSFYRSGVQLSTLLFLGFQFSPIIHLVFGLIHFQR